MTIKTTLQSINTTKAINNEFWNQLTNVLMGTNLEDGFFKQEQGVNMSACTDVYAMDKLGQSKAYLRDEEDSYDRGDVGISDMVESDVWLTNRGLDRESLVREERLENRIWDFKDAKYRYDLWKHNLASVDWKVSKEDYSDFMRETKRLKYQLESIKREISDIDASYGKLYDDEDSYHGYSTKGEEILAYIKNNVTSGNWDLGKCAMVLDLLDEERANMSYENRILAEGHLLRRLVTEGQEDYSVIKTSRNGNPYVSHYASSGYLKADLDNCIAKYRFLVNDKAKLDDSPSHDDRFFGEMSIGSMEDLIDLKRNADSISNRHNISLEECFMMLQSKEEFLDAQQIEIQPTIVDISKWDEDLDNNSIDCSIEEYLEELN